MALQDETTQLKVSQLKYARIIRRRISCDIIPKYRFEINHIVISEIPLFLKKLKYEKIKKQDKRSL